MQLLMINIYQKYLYSLSILLITCCKAFKNLFFEDMKEEVCTPFQNQRAMPTFESFHLIKETNKLSFYLGECFIIKFRDSRRKE